MNEVMTISLQPGQVFLRDGHPNPRGHQQIAADIFQYLNSAAVGTLLGIERARGCPWSKDTLQLILKHRKRKRFEDWD